MDPATAPLISATALVSGYGDLDVCGPLDLELKPGQALGIVGFNAAGKSTLLRTLVGYQEPVSGDVLIMGAFTDDSSYLYRRAVSVVLDEDAFFPSLSVQEHLTLVAQGHGVPNVAAAIEFELEFFELAGARTDYPHTLSSGQRRRLLLAAALLRPAQLLVLDEPEQRLDPIMRTALAARLHERVSGGTALLVVTHDPVFLAVVAQRALVIADGSIMPGSIEAAADAIRNSGA